MKTAIAIGLATVAGLLTGCGDTVPSVADPHNIVVNGKAMTQQEFVTTYCAGKTGHETCDKVSQAMAADSSKSKSGPSRF